MADVVEYPLKAIERITMERNRLAAEVEKLTAQLAAVRVAVESRGHDTRCNAFADNAADCGCGYREARRAVGLEG